MVTVAVIIGFVAFIATISAQQSSADEKEKFERLEYFIFQVIELEHQHYHHKHVNVIRFFDKETANLRLQFLAIVHKEEQTKEEFAAALDTLFAGSCSNIETAYKTFKMQDAANRTAEYDTKVASLSPGAKSSYDKIKAVHEDKSLSRAEREKDEIKFFNETTADQQKELQGVFPRLAEKAEIEKKVGRLSPGAKTVYEAIKAVIENNTLSYQEKVNEGKKLFFAATADQQNELPALHSYFEEHIKYEVEAAKRKAQFEKIVTALSPGAKKVYEQIKAMEEDKGNEETKLFAAATADEQKELKALYWHYVHHHQIENEAEKAIHKAKFQAKIAALSPDAKKVFESIKTVVDNNTLSDEDKEKEAKKLFIAAPADQQKELEALYSHWAKHRFENQLKANSEQAATSVATTAGTTAATSAATNAPTVGAPVQVA